MDVTNGTGDGTDYRTGSGTTKMIARTPLTHLPSKAVAHVPDPKLDARIKSWSISFRLPDGEIISATFKQLMKSVTLVKKGNAYQINAVKKSMPKSTPKPQAKKPAKAAKPPKKSAA